MYDKKPFEHKPNSGSIIPIPTKQNPKAPDYKGSARIKLSDFEVVNGCIDIDIAGWKQTTPSGKPRLSLLIQKPWKPENKTAGYSRTQEKQDDLDEEIPF
ncbi:hypothetical protein UFOVP274_66 [uncultured Caudovirales phage]|uniref:Uncharacterized protein n=1 Tax=uncultured Caudovirales phage TaxID=2100421 RepID=A0A6J5LMK5_9CAUD|nr:hypothetical protein UFOVP274_66 [uncultured Caudovirales phage]